MELGMKKLEDKVAVITGAASGIGFAIATQALERGMRIVVADINPSALEQAVDSLGGGNSVLAVVTDVSSRASVQNLAQRTKESFGAVYLLFNNAGVGGGGPVWEQSEAEWDFVLGVNLKGVVNGVSVFTPDMIDQREGHIVNTASIAGLVSSRDTSTYGVSKHGVVALSEILLGDLQAIQSPVGVSVLCPSFVNTNIYKMSGDRGDQDKAEATAEQQAELDAVEQMIGEFFQNALSPDAVAEQVFESIAQNRFYILTHPEGSRVQIEERMRGILEGVVPAIVPSGGFPLS
ncbi:MAG: NADP-dependent 3-hydroxy acid dehydrogenase YdfG [Bacteroidia bacterium]|jgi:NADP-dependent 3-hydroxy acid dehydrogenase YdfG